jgi:hypothetical protein
MTRKNDCDKNAKGLRQNAKGFRGGFERCAALVALIGLLSLVSGCSTPRTSEYEADTTPGHNGEHWIGGAE